MRDPLGRPVPSLADVLLYLLGVAGTAAGITLLFLGMRAVMDIGGACAEGGPYVPAQPCPEGSSAATLLGIFGGLGSAFLAAWKGLAIGERAASVVFLAWPALFGALGFNFLQYGFDPPGDDPGWAWGWLICGVVFWVMAFGPLLLGVRLAADGARPGARATRAMPGGPAMTAQLRRARAVRDTRRAVQAGTPYPIDMAEVEARLGLGSAAPPSDSRPHDLVDGLERLADLHRAGSLTDEEYARAKVELLERSGA